MFNFNLKESGIYVALRWEKFPLFRFAKACKKIFFLLFLFLFLFFLYSFIPEKFSEDTAKLLLGLSIIFFDFYFFFLLIQKFLDLKLKKPKIKILLKEAAVSPQSYNLAEFLSFGAAKAVNSCLKFNQPLFKKRTSATSTQLFYFLLVNNPKLNFIFFRALLNIKEIKEILMREIRGFQAEKTDDSEVFSPTFQEVILEALKIAQEKNHSRIEVGDVLAALARQDLFFKKILIHSKLKSEDIENLAWLMEKLEEKIEKNKKFWEYENLAKRGTLAREWTAGYTITLDKYSIDITDGIRRNLPDVIGHQKEIEIVERILARREINNALIIGEPGTGRKSMVYALAKKSLMGESLPEVNYKRLVQLDMAALLAELQDIEEVESTLNKIFEEAVLAGNVILVIDELHNYIGQVGKAGIVDISGIITPYLRLPQFQIVAITTYDGLHRYIERNPSALSLFEKVEVSGISPRETIMVLENLIPGAEEKYKIFVSYPAIREIISLTERYFSSFPFPEKALDIFEEVVVYVANFTKDRVVLPKHIAKIITQKTEIPVGEIETKEREVLLNLESLIHQRIINQEEAVKEVATALRRARSDITVRKGPMGAFLFLGPTGVGKTETSKALAEFYFGSENRMIRLDMSEFQAIEDIPRIIGSDEAPGLLTDPVRETPFSLVLLDEFEKAHPNILNLFLQVFDEGHLTDGLGRKIDFKNTIIIATSNAGYQIILEALKEKIEWSNLKEKLLDFLFKEGAFRPELINRFDAAVVFKPLTKENLLDIAQLLLNKLNKNLKEKGIEFLITEALKEKIVELGYNPVFGAREIRRVIQDKIENNLASALLSGKLIRGNSVAIDPQTFQLDINPQNF